MKIGTVKELKMDESRVGIIPSGAEILMEQGHSVYIQSEAGLNSGFMDQDYAEIGAIILKDAKEVWEQCDMIIKVKEPQEIEYLSIRKGQILLTYFHFAASKKLTNAVIQSKCSAIAYETVRARDGSLPLLKPMSEVAGRMSIQEGAKYLEKAHGGRGILLGGVPGVAPATVVVLGAGVVGTHAVKMAAGLGSLVYVLDTNLERLRYLSDLMPNNVITLLSNPLNIRNTLKNADLVVSSILIPGAKAPKLIKKKTLKSMKSGAVIIDVAIDQGGSTETSKPTTHARPTYKVDEIIHYCVANMPGAMPLTSTIALTNATIRYAESIANLGIKKALSLDPYLAMGLSTHLGHVCCPQVASVFNYKHVDWRTVV